MEHESSEKIVQTPGPWSWRRGYGGRWELIAPHSGTLLVMDAVRSGMQRGQVRLARRTRGDAGGLMVDSDKIPDVKAHPDARLMQQAPAMDLLLKLLRSGQATFYPATGELVFDGLMYSTRDMDWSGVLDVIGWEKARKAGG